PLAAVFGSAALVRVLLFHCVSLPSGALLLYSGTSRSSSSFQEALAREAAGLSPLAAGIYVQTPPLFVLLKHLTGCGGSGASCNALRLFLLLLAVDLGVAAALATAAAQLQPHADEDGEERLLSSLSPLDAQAASQCFSLVKEKRLLLQQRERLGALASQRFISPTLAAALFLFHPYTVAGSLALSPHHVPLLLLSLAIVTGAFAARAAEAATTLRGKEGGQSAAAQGMPSHPLKRRKGVAAAAAAAVQGSLWESFASQWHLEPIDPGLGGSWYLLALAFERYRRIFVFALQAAAFVLMVPLTLAFAGNPLSHCQAAVASMVLFQQNPSLTEFAFLQVLLAFHWREMQQRVPFSKLVGLSLLAAALLPVAFSLWMDRGVGTANIAYALQCLHYTFSCLLVTETLRGAAQREQRYYQLQMRA
ncbi:uncharacterized protein LOC34619877, partial [Cyclospora cayetanensis]|uniref:Uncharacterized protein LOC34619877 n=1 Tax=Cyclospora cayetanensis TaxID=88456 RepID=A0A6P6S070_9EIME